MTTQQFKQWTLETTEDGYKLYNLGEDGVKKFYEVVMGPYGNPLTIIEPDLAFDVPTGLTYLDSKGVTVVPTEKIGGIICQEDNGTAKYRFSLSSKEAPKFDVTSDGIVIDGTHWFLSTLFTKDKKRTFNYDAFYVLKKPATVKLLELADLNFDLL